MENKLKQNYEPVGTNGRSSLQVFFVYTFRHGRNDYLNLEPRHFDKLNEN